MNAINIELNRREFTGGDTVSGEVVVHLEEDTPLRGIRLKLQGYEQSGWREGSGKHRHTHSEKRHLFNEDITLQGRPRLGFGELVADSLKGVFSKEDYEVLRADTYRYPFSYRLPLNLPGDYESALTNSRIYYGLKAEVDLPLKLDLKTVLPLVVHESSNPVDPQAVSQRRTKSFLFDPDALVEAAVHLDKDAYRVGETLHCLLEVMNRAPRKDIHAATVALRQIETLKAQGHTHQTQAQLSRASFKDLRFPLKNRTSVDLEYQIPGDLYPTITGANLVKLEYELQVRMDIPWALDAKLGVPIRLIRGSEVASPS